MRVHASKNSRHSKFPPTPPSARHPHFRGSLSLPGLCESWRAAAPPAPLRLGSGGSGGGAPQLLLTKKSPEHYDAYEFEVMSLAPEAARLGPGAFLLPRPLPLAVLSRMEGLRAAIDPVLAAPSAGEVIEAVRGLPGTRRCIPSECPLAIYHEKLSAVVLGEGGVRMSSPELYGAIVGAVKGWGGDLSQSTYGRLRSTARPGAAEEMLRLAVVELDEVGYVFGAVAWAPAPPAPGAAFEQKPHNYSAALPFSLASVMVSIAAGGGAWGTGAWGEGKEPLLVDPCCGSGTIPFAAWAKGLAAAGGDIEAGVLGQARENLAASRGAADAAAAGRRRVLELGLGGAAEAGSGSGSGTEAGAGEPPLLYCGSVLDMPLPVPRLGRGGTAVCTNLPFGRMAAVSRGGGFSKEGASGEELEELLGCLRPQAGRHVLVAGVPLAGTLERLGYGGVREVALPKRRWLSCATGGEGRG